MEVAFVKNPTEEEIRDAKRWSATSKKILEFIQAKRSASTSELQQLTGYRPGTISAQISLLGRMGFVKTASGRAKSRKEVTVTPSLKENRGEGLQGEYGQLGTGHDEEAWGGLRPLLDISRSKVIVSKNYTTDFDVLISHNDVLEFLSAVPDNTFQLVVTSPPYNIGKPYEKRQEFMDYLEWQRQVSKECARVLKPGGSLCWEVGNYIENGEVFPLDVFFYDLIKENPEFYLRNRIIWFFEHGLHASKRFSGRYETILWFSKGKEYVFNLDNVRVPQKYPGKTYYKGPKHGMPSANPRGKNPGDIWRTKLLEDWDTLVWDIPNVKSNHPEKTKHPAQFPIELVERLVLALTNPRDIVFDPFVGVGSTLIAALVHDRRAVGVDKEKQYFDIAIDRVNKAMHGRLKYRPLGTQKYIPTGKEKVSQIPKQWLEQSS